MSVRVMSWALNEAPVEEPVQVIILVAMAERANDDGTDTHQSIATIAEKARVSSRTVQRELRKLELMGIISKGEQGHVSQFPGNRRPVVYDINTKLRRGDRLTPQRGDTVTTPLPEDSGATSTTFRGDTEPLRGDTEGGLGATRTAHNTSITRPLNSSIDSGGTTAPQEALIPAEKVRGTAVAVPPGQPMEAVLAKRAYDNTRGSLPYMGMMKISQWALKQDYTPQQIEWAISTLWRGGRAVTQQAVGQTLQGIIGADGRTAKQSTTDQRVSAGLELAEHYRKLEEQAEQS